MKKNKGFTLIELLVVVAIIGTLAAVGVVAYNGYTAAAKKNSSKAIHSNAVKYIASELAKCSLDLSSELYGGTAVTCASAVTEIVTHLAGAGSPMQDKNPYDSSESAITTGTSTTTQDDAGNDVVTVTCDEGYTCLAGDDDTSKITISTNYDADTDNLNNTIQKE